MRTSVDFRIKSLAIFAHTKYLCGQKIVKKWNQKMSEAMESERGDVPGWVLVVLMTTGLVTAIWTIAAPRLTGILKNSLDAMNGIR